MRGKNIISQKSQRHRRTGDIFSDALKKCIIGPSTVMMRRQLFEESCGFRTDIEIAEDYEYWLRICNREEVAYIDDALVIKRAGHAGQLSAKYGQIEIFRINCLRELIDNKVFQGDKMIESLDELSRKCTIYARGCRVRGKDDEAKEYELLSRYWNNHRKKLVRGY
jgi:hypothetical protein